jgi:mitogen-activated protein kinase kinase
MTPSSTPLGPTNAARNRPGPMPTLSSSRSGMSSLPPDMAAKLQAFAAGRRGAPPAANLRTGAPPAPGAQPNLQSPSSPRVGAGGMGGVPAQFAGMSLSGRAPPPQAGPTGPIPNRGAPPRQLSMAERRGLNLGSGAAPAAGSAAPAKKGRPVMSLSSMNGGDASAPPQKQETMIDKFSEYLDKETGALNFKGKATLTNQGVKFASGKTFSISLDEVDTLDELGKGNYGTVYKVRHSRPKIRKVGQGLAGNKLSVIEREKAESDSPVIGSGTGVVMAMKEMRLELDDNKFATIIMELDVLHRCTSPYIVDFYGAFFQEGAVYICMEFMDGGSVDKLYGDGVPEGVLSKITLSTVLGLKSLKDEHNIIHRDVKPTNILVNTAGQVKICDFGVSGNLVASMAKTNIGCQSYMAPERINGGGIAQAGANPGGGTYSVQSDIWSLGLTIIECGLGRYPYPPETYDNIFSQLSVSSILQHSLLSY